MRNQLTKNGDIDQLAADEKRKLLAQLLQQRQQKPKLAPLSFGQERLWFLHQLDRQQAAYNLRTAVRLRGHLQIDVLTQCLQTIVARHESLRTQIITDGETNTPRQQIFPKRTLDLPLVDLSGVAVADRDDAIQQATEAEVQAPFDLEQDALLRAKLLKVQPDDHILLLTIHHIISDGWSIGILIREIATLYKATIANLPAPLPELPVQYADYARWQRDYLQGEVLDAQIGYWRDQLSNSAVIDLPTDFARPAVQTFVGARHYFTIDPAVSQTLRDLTQSEGATLFMSLMAAFNILLYRYSQQTDIAVGTPVAGRTRKQVEGLIGLFINTLVMRNQLDPQASFRSFLKQVRQTALDAYAHQDVPFEKLVEELKPQRDPSRTPYFQHLFIMQNAPMQGVTLPELSLTPIKPDKASSLFDITLTMWDDDRGLHGYLEYNTDLFTDATMARFVDHFQELLAQIGAHPDAPVATLSMLPSAEAQQLLVDWNATTRPMPPLTLTQRFSQQAARTPDAIAVSASDGDLTYAELDARANQLAATLRGHNLPPDTLIGLALPRQTDMLVAILGILKAGAAYLPIDPAYPAQRIQYMLEHAQAPLLITHGDILAQLPPHDATPILLDDRASWADQPAAPVDASRLDDLAYVIYTSGSTGKPKGVQITQRNLANFLFSMQQEPGLSAEDTLLAVTTLSFDIATLELYLPLLVGARVLLADQATAQDATKLIEVLGREPVTLMQATPATWQMLLAAGWQGKPDLTVLSGGEALPATLANELLSRSAAVWNMYGPTETTVWSTCLNVTEAEASGDVVSIGRPIANTDIYILDSQLSPVPVGVVGDLHIGGDGVARGYLHRPDLTAERFVAHPFSAVEGARIYKTGDLARYLPDGRIAFLGRVDNQIKLRGFRIELGEIENGLQTHPAIAQAVVHPQGNQLVAYLIAKTDAQPAVGDLRSHLQASLPAYMIPQRFLFLEAYPLTPNGKVDRKRLPAPSGAALQSSQYVAPRSPIEEALVAIWQDLLDLPKIGVEDNFFELGGHSLLATQLVSKIRQTLNAEIPLRALFEAGTVAKLAELVADARDLPQAPPILPQPDDAPKPVSFAQQRLWVLDQLEPELTAYNLPAAVRLSGPIDHAAFEAALNALVARHASLRTSFDMDKNGQPVQTISAEIPLTIPTTIIDEADAVSAVADVVQQPFDLTEAPLIRVELLQISPTDHLLVIVMHHIISDGWSINIFVRELAALYQAFLHDQPDPLPALPVQYSDFAAWQTNWLQGDVLDAQITYWQKRLEGAPFLLNLPTDHPRPATQSYAGALYRSTLPASLSQRIQSFSREANATPFMTLLTAYQLLLGRYAGQHDVVVGSPIANRTRNETENLIGFFINMLVWRLQIGADDGFDDLLAQVRQHALDGYAHQDVPFEKLVDRLNVTRDISYSPVFQVAFIMQNTPQSRLDLGELTMDVVSAETDVAKYDLTLTVLEGDAGYRLIWEYCTDLFEEATIARLAAHFEQLLSAALAEPQASALSLPLLLPSERQTLLEEWNATTRPRPDLTLTQQFSEQAARTPSAVALSAIDGELTYAELDARSNQLAAYLLKHELSAETLIGVALPRETDMLVAVLGILKAGAAYLPIDPTYPAQRIQYMLTHAEAPLIITTSDILDNLPTHDAQPILIDTNWDAIAQHPTASRDVSKLNNLAYVIYTSGSTGKPKGVQITHRNLINFLNSMRREPSISAEDTLLAVTTLSFDIATLELYLPLLVGARIVMADQETAFDASKLMAFLDEQPISMMQATPATWQMLLNVGWAGKAGLKMLVGGEALPRDLAERMLDRGAELWNMYGPTETTVWSTCLQVTHDQLEADNIVSIGTPIDNTDIYILDDRLSPVPIGVVGDLYIGGEGVARGYLHRPELTAERFVAHPFSPDAEARLYKTGDLARYLPDGRIAFLGRDDNQIKLRGFRIELGEIENALQSHSDIAQAVVHPKGDQLFAYLLAQPEAKPAVADLRAHLQTMLPAYMVPQRFLFLDAFPLTPNGKVDRKALPEPEQDRTTFGTSYVAPTTEQEQMLAAMWADILNIEQVGIHDNFFNLGGHSLLATQLVSRVQQQVQVDLPLRTLFENPTIANLAAIIAEKQEQQAGAQSLDDLLAEIEALSDDEVMAVLTSDGPDEKGVAS